MSTASGEGVDGGVGVGVGDSVLTGTCACLASLLRGLQDAEVPVHVWKQGSCGTAHARAAPSQRSMRYKCSAVHQDSCQT